MQDNAGKISGIKSTAGIRRGVLRMFFRNSFTAPKMKTPASGLTKNEDAYANEDAPSELIKERGRLRFISERRGANVFIRASARLH